MEVCKTKEEYIKYVAPFAQRACKRFEKELGQPFYLASVLIAQSCLENGYSLDKSCLPLVRANNMVGIKRSLLNPSWTDVGLGCWDGKYINKKTPEVYDGVPTQIYDDFRIYKDVEQSFVDYLCFMRWGGYSVGNPKYYPNIKDLHQYKPLIKKVHELGYATDPEYSDSVIRILEENNLTKYDDLSNVEPSSYWPTGAEKKTDAKIVKITPKTITDITKENLSQVPASRGKNSIDFIVCHYLGVPNADNPYLYGGGYGGHYNIKRNGSIYLAANPRTAVIWHCGGGLQGSGGHSFYGICGNYNSIGIECGVCYDGTEKEPSGDSNKWWFTEETQESLIYLVSKLMDEYGISIDHVIRHWDVTGKCCPNPYVKNNNLHTSWTWSQFKSNLKQYRKDGTITIPDGSSGGGVTPEPEPTRNYLQKGDTGAEVKTMQTLLTQAGFDCKGIDGDFGNNTLKALKAFQKAYGLTVDGLYGPASKSKLESITHVMSAKDITVDQFLTSAKKTMDTARKGKYKYGDSHAVDPTTDKLISCDRLIAKALYDLGFKDQRAGGETCGTLDTYLNNHGFERSTSKSAIKSGSILLVKHDGHTYISHAFIVVNFDANTWKTDRYDAGSQERIDSVQPLKGVSWGYRKDDVIVYNIPEKEGQIVYRVRLGIFSNQDNVKRLIKKVEDTLDLKCFTEDKADGTHVFCGSFNTYSNAVERSKLLNDNKFDTKIVKVKV